VGESALTAQQSPLIMVTQYDAIADHYRRSKRSPLREYIEAYTFLQLIGDVRGKAVLDLACGEGYYTRRLSDLGAGPVVGVDISSAMIDLAAAEERTRPLGLRYVCADVADMPALGQFDLVVAAYLLHYARDADNLLRMAHNIARHLAPGGRFVTLNENPSQPPERYRGYDQYGFNKTVALPRRDGSVITYRMVAGRELFSFDVHHFARSTYEQVLARAGFSAWHWHPVGLDPAGAAETGAAYWQEYLSNPPVIGLEACA
jgi:SAM-dependent methyltransferase